MANESDVIDEMWVLTEAVGEIAIAVPIDEEGRLFISCVL